MKKLESKIFGNGIVLTRDELKNVMGGVGHVVGTDPDCNNTGLCSTVTEEKCCDGYVCVGQKGNEPGMCGPAPSVEPN